MYEFSEHEKICTAQKLAVRILRTTQWRDVASMRQSLAASEDGVAPLHRGEPARRSTRVTRMPVASTGYYYKNKSAFWTFVRSYWLVLVIRASTSVPAWMITPF